MPVSTYHVIALGLLLIAPVHAQDGAAQAAPPTGDGVAIATVIAVNDHEIRAAELALGKDISVEAQQYARTMARDHGDNQATTKTLATTTAPVENDELEALKQKTSDAREKMAKLDGIAFEMAYIGAMVKDHEEVLAMLDGQLIPSATDPAVIAHLNATRAHVAHHLDAARKLRNEPAENG